MIGHPQPLKFASRIGVRCCATAREPSMRLPATAPAVRLMTDFTTETALVVEPVVRIDEALEKMRRHGVRALLVVEGEDLLGLVSAYDILGEKPIQFLQNPVCDHYPCTHLDVHVGNVMTPLEELPVLDRDWVESATIADVLAAFDATVHMHLLVVQRSDPDEVPVACGLFSRTRLERALARQAQGHA